MYMYVVFANKLRATYMYMYLIMVVKDFTSSLEQLVTTCSLVVSYIFLAALIYRHLVCTCVNFASFPRDPELVS